LIFELRFLIFDFAFFSNSIFLKSRDLKWNLSKVKVQKSKTDNIMNLELFFKILSVVFIGIAAYFLWSGSKDGTFVSAVLGAVCFFLSVRFQIVERKKQREVLSTKEHEESTKIETE